MKIFLSALTITALVLPLPAQEAAQEKEDDPNFLHRRGTEHFFAGRIKQSLQDWDRVVKMVPQQAPHH